MSKVLKNLINYEFQKLVGTLLLIFIFNSYCNELISYYTLFYKNQ